MVTAVATVIAAVAAVADPVIRNELTAKFTVRLIIPGICSHSKTVIGKDGLKSPNLFLMYTVFMVMGIPAAKGHGAEYHKECQHKTEQPSCQP